jgi:glutaredoxin
MVNVMKVVEVPGRNSKHKVFLYVLSTCAWCKSTKKFLKDNSIKYEYVDVDLCNEEERKKIRGEIMKRGEIPSYPAIIIDGKELIIGFHQDKIREALEI